MNWLALFGYNLEQEISCELPDYPIHRLSEKDLAQWASLDADKDGIVTISDLQSYFQHHSTGWFYTSEELIEQILRCYFPVVNAQKYSDSYIRSAEGIDYTNLSQKSEAYPRHFSLDHLLTAIVFDHENNQSEVTGCLTVDKRIPRNAKQIKFGEPVELDVPLSSIAEQTRKKVNGFIFYDLVTNGIAKADWSADQQVAISKEINNFFVRNGLPHVRIFIMDRATGPVFSLAYRKCFVPDCISHYPYKDDKPLGVSKKMLKALRPEFAKINDRTPECAFIETHDEILLETPQLSTLIRALGSHMRSTRMINQIISQPIKEIEDRNMEERISARDQRHKQEWLRSPEYAALKQEEAAEKKLADKIRAKQDYENQVADAASQR